MAGSSARKTTLGHMSRLMATAALASTVACSKCGSGSTGGGYGVVDPMPTPARCYGGGVVATARWVPKPGGGRLLEVDVTAAAVGPGFSYGPPTVQGGTLVSAPPPYDVTPPTSAGVFAVPTVHDAGRADARAPAASSDAAAPRGADAGATDASADAGPTTSAIGPVLGTFRIEPSSPTVHLVFDSTCTGATGTLNISISSGHTKSGGEELVTNVNET